MKTAGSAIYANRHYLALYKQKQPDRLASMSNGSCNIIGDVYIHPSATVHPTSTVRKLKCSAIFCTLAHALISSFNFLQLGPNVSIGPNTVIGPGVRIRESIILANANIQAHSLILYSIIGTGTSVGEWARVEGTPCDPNPNKPFAKMENLPLFNVNGKLNPSITILGKETKCSAIYLFIILIYNTYL